jgi:hypothetical protein
MEKAIENLNNVQEIREFLISQILFVEANGKSNVQYEKLEQSLQSKPFSFLDKKVTKLRGNWRLMFGIKAKTNG